MGKNIVLVIAGNKSDLEKYRQVEEKEAVAYAESVGALHIQCSAKTGTNVEQAFLQIAKGILKHQQDSKGNNNHQQPQPTQPLVNNPRGKIDFQGEDDDSSGGCC